jgi:hypothetical protein
MLNQEYQQMPTVPDGSKPQDLTRADCGLLRKEVLVVLAVEPLVSLGFDMGRAGTSCQRPLMA